MAIAPGRLPLRVPGDVSRMYPALVPKPWSVNTPDHTFTVREAAALLGVCRMTILRRLKRGELRGGRLPIPQVFAWRVELPIHELQEDV